MSPAADAVIQRLDTARQKWWFFTLATTTIMAVCLSLGLLLTFMLTDALVKFSQISLWIMFFVWLASTVALIVIVSRRLLRSQRSLEATARRVEAEYPELGSSLINLVQFSDDVYDENRAFRDAAVNEAAAKIGHMRFEGAATKESRWRRLLYCMQTPRDFVESSMVLAVLIVIAVVCQLLFANFGSAASRLMTPWQFVPSVGSVRIDVTPGDCEVMLGGSLEIVATIDNPESIPYEATLFVTPEGEGETRRPMVATDQKGRNYALTLPSVIKPLEYRLEIGDSQTPVFHVVVRAKPTIEEVRVTYHFPAYLNRPKETFAQDHADLQAPQYTTADLEIVPSTAIMAGLVRLGNMERPGTVGPEGTLLVERIPLINDGTFTVHMYSDIERKLTDPNPRQNRIRVVPDRPPTAQLAKPLRRSTSAPGADVAVMIRGSDDHGVGELRLEMQVRDEEPAADLLDGVPPDVTALDAEPSQPDEELPIAVLQTWKWSRSNSSTTPVKHHRLELDSQRFQAGQIVKLRAVAKDLRRVNGLEPQETAGPWHLIRLIGEEEKSTGELQQLDTLRNAIFKILQSQIRARSGAARLVQGGRQADAAAAMAAELRTRQVGVQKDSIALVKSIARTDREERLAVKRILSTLAFGDMLQAVRQCDELVKLLTAPSSETAAPLEQPVGDLTTTQDRVIDVLRKLLDVTRQAQADVLGNMKKRPGADLPDDVVRKLDEARKKLDEFLYEQKKVIEASESLAKTPVDDFGEEEEQLLKELAAAEDDWAKFMKELHTDLSKLPEQDFANPALLEELVEIQTEIKMAEDALLKKTADIAVPLEQLGAEMAEEIKTNLEKWLPDTPDRERWSQEESLTDEDKEAPMAELPGELEDLIGELLEEEEDLFDEMEDVSSSAADSLDKGAGWDVADGPISNMSAKGATGNRLPNTSEIGGRAGEGRSGKSSGEFVGDEAVGKGGRKTPSRLTPDPFVKGQIKDHSKDPTGGATGGGKESGQGGEGLEGPMRRPPGQRDLQRLAGKQAALRNRAEAVDVQFQVLNFHHTDLKKMIAMMAQIERDLKAGRYQNALRRRRVMVDGLGNVKQYLEGEFEVRQDTTSNLPTDVQKQLHGSMQDPSPAGWEELNRQYFERLSTGGVGTGLPAP